MKEMLNDCVILRQTKSGTIRLSRSNTKSKEFGNYLKDFLGTTLNRISFTISKSSLESPDYIVDLDVRVENVLALSITFMKDECIYKYGYHAYVWFKYAKKLKSYLNLDYPVEKDTKIYNIVIDTICSKYLDKLYIKEYVKRGESNRQ